jgi:hypothetical protein
VRIGSVSPIEKVTLTVAFVLLLLVSRGNACEWAIGYFHQVTGLKGRVVGADVRGLPRWLRQSFPRKHAKLALYDYRWPRVAWDDGTLAKTVETDERGNFDFGPLKTGHYTLKVDDGDLFDVEVKDMQPVTESVIIDVSPFYPDCTGGHEFIVSAK